MKVRYHIGKWGSRPRRQYWIAGLALTALLALAMGCQQEPPAAAPAAPVDGSRRSRGASCPGSSGRRARRSSGSVGSGGSSRQRSGSGGRSGAPG